MEILKWAVIFSISLFVVLKSASYFTDTSERIGTHFKIPPFIIGVTIIALGTSLPEIATSARAVMAGSSEMVIGNVVGSNIANILLVLGLTAIITKKVVIHKDIINVDLPILLGSTILLYISILDGEFGLLDAVLSMAGLITYIIYNASSEHRVEAKGEKEIKELEKEEKKKIKKERLDIKYPLILIASGVALYFSAQYTVEAAIQIAEIFKVSEYLISVTIIAVGTSLPELAVSIAAAKQGKADMAIGNITGSNIFNSLGVMSIASLFGTLQIPETVITYTIPILIFVTILYLFVTMVKQISKWEGVILTLIYIAFLLFSIKATTL